MAYEFKFPDVGEGITEGELLSWKVKEGDVVVEDQTLAEMETDKAVVEMPSPRAGRIVEAARRRGRHHRGRRRVGDHRGGGGRPRRPASRAGGGLAAPVPRRRRPHRRPPLRPPAPRPAPAPTPAPPSAKAESYTGSVVGRLEEAPDEEERGRPRLAAAPVAPRSAETRVLAMPSVRALAKELGVDLNRVRGTGPGGRILQQDVEDWAEAGVVRPRDGARRPPSPRRTSPPARRWMGGYAARTTSTDWWSACPSAGSGAAWPGAWPRLVGQAGPGDHHGRGRRHHHQAASARRSARWPPSAASV